MAESESHVVQVMCPECEDAGGSMRLFDRNRGSKAKFPNVVPCKHRQG